MIVNIPGQLREFTGGADRVFLDATGPTLADALAALWARYPALRDRVTTEQGEIREHINIFVGHEMILYTGGLMTPVSTDSELSIIPAISGGSAGC
jgi:molybdopterin synthase sulfur carrier subunit